MGNERVIPTFGFSPLDDETMDRGKNALPAIHDQILAYIHRLNGIAYSGRPLYNFWGGEQALPGDAASDPQLRWAYNHHAQAGRLLRGKGLYLPQQANGSESSPVMRVTLNGSDYDEPTMRTFIAAPPGGPALVFPRQLEPILLGAEINDSTFGRKEVLVKAIPGAGSESARMESGMFYEKPETQAAPESTNPIVPWDWVGPNFGIVAEGAAGDFANMQRLNAKFLHIWNRKRPGFVWSAQQIPSGEIALTTSPMDWRYLFKQTIGDGGTPPSVTGHGITFPLYKAGSGRSVTMQFGMHVYAAMSGATDTGSPAIAHRAAGGATMTTFASPVSGGFSIAGATPAWYPALTSDPAIWTVRTDLDYERILPAFKSSGAMDHVVVHSILLFPYHSSIIP